MGIFDIFKKNESVKNTDSGLSSASENELTPENEEMKAVYAESLAKTERIATLLEIPKGDRDDSWIQRFLTDLPEASFRSGNPQVIAGLDGFPYFQLVLPEPGTEFQSFVIDKMKDDFLLERGFGVVINPGTEQQPDWVLTYGDILNFQLNGSFFTEESTFSQNMESEIVKEKEEVLIGQPSETILPAATRKLLKDFFELNGIADPKVLLMMRKHGEQTTQDLAFNITPDQFETEEHFRNMMQTVTWYLPRHYSIIGLKDDAFDNGFMPL